MGFITFHLRVLYLLGGTEMTSVSKEVIPAPFSITKDTFKEC